MDAYNNGLPMLIQILEPEGKMTRSLAALPRLIVKPNKHLIDDC